MKPITPEEAHLILWGEKMTHEEAHLEMCEELLDSHKERLMEAVKRKYRSGGVDVTQFQTNHYILAKLLVTSALRDECNIFEPSLPEHEKILNNLKHF